MSLQGEEDAVIARSACRAKGGKAILKQDILMAWTVALFIHVLFFSLTGKMFLKSTQFAIAPTRAIEDSLPADSKRQVIDINLMDMPKEMVQAQEQAKPVIKGVEKIIPKAIKSVVKDIGKPKQVMRSSVSVRFETKPDYNLNPPPPYPELARQMRQEGIVMLSVDVDKQGEAVSVKIVQSSGFRLLDQAALKAVRHWKFQPGKLGDIVVESVVHVPVRFRLQE